MLCLQRLSNRLTPPLLNIARYSLQKRCLSVLGTSLWPYVQPSNHLNLTTPQRLFHSTMPGNPEDSYKASFETGKKMMGMGKVKEAIEVFQKAAHLAEAVHDSITACEAYEGMGMCYDALREVSHAVTSHEKGLEVAQKTNDVPLQIKAYGCLADLHLRQGEGAKARDRCASSVALFEKHNCALGSGGYSMLGAAYQIVGNLSNALECQEKSLQMAKVSGDVVRQATAYANQGSVHQSMQNYQRAATCYEQASELFRQRGMKEEGQALIGLGAAQKGMQHYEEAIRSYQAAAAIFQRYEDFGREANCYQELAAACGGSEKLDEATRWYEKAAGTYHWLGDNLHAGEAWARAGLAAYRLKDYSQTSAYLTKYLMVAPEGAQRLPKGAAHGLLGFCFNEIGDPNNALVYYEQALRFAREIHNRQMEGMTLQGLGKAYQMMGDQIQADKYLREAAKVLGES